MGVAITYCPTCGWILRDPACARCLGDVDFAIESVFTEILE